jgi:hypothetical protein
MEACAPPLVVLKECFGLMLKEPNPVDFKSTQQSFGGLRCYLITSMISWGGHSQVLSFTPNCASSSALVGGFCLITLF